MRFYIFYLLFALGISISSCKSNTDSIEIVEIKMPMGDVFEGDFVYTMEAAVLTGNSFIYGINMNSLARELGARVEKIKKTEQDIVPVKVRGVLKSKPADAEGWDKILTITDIIEISNTPKQADIRL